MFQCVICEDWLHERVSLCWFLQICLLLSFPASSSFPPPSPFIFLTIYSFSSFFHFPCPSCLVLLSSFLSSPIIFLTLSLIPFPPFFCLAFHFWYFAPTPADFDLSYPSNRDVTSHYLKKLISPFQHLNLVLPDRDVSIEIVCSACMKACPFLWSYQLMDTGQ